MNSNNKVEKTKRKLEALRRKEEEKVTQILSEKYGIPYTDLTIFPIEIDAIQVLSEDEAREGELAVIQKSGKNLKVAVRSPEKEKTKAVLSRLKKNGYKPSLILVSTSSLKRAWEFYKKVPERHRIEAGIITIKEQLLFSVREEISGFGDIAEKIQKTLTGRTTEILEIMLAGALAVEASDIHIEPQKKNVRVRLRIDGILHDIIEIPQKVYNLLLSRLKLISELKLNIKDQPQDGRFTIKSGDYEIEIRVSTLPGPAGENIVLRILDPHVIQIDFENLGMQSWIIKTMETELKRPNGMILTTGPTGSGKTTTLYAFLKKIYSPGVKIITIEDPIEYHLSGIEQTQVEPEKGYNFANGLRSIVRQDPDIILVGEIRDLETAEIAMHAALTGHLVFSTLHTNNAAGTVPRLIDLGVKPSIIAPAINITMAQRLVRKLCYACKIKSKLNKDLKKKITKELKGFPKNVKIPAPEEWQIFEANPNGCPKCNNLGYKGRIGVFEIILIDDNLEQLILKGPSEVEIKKAAHDEGQITMRQDGILKILAGITDFAELERVIGSK